MLSGALLPACCQGPCCQHAVRGPAASMQAEAEYSRAGQGCYLPEIKLKFAGLKFVGWATFFLLLGNGQKMPHNGYKGGKGGEMW